MNRSLFEWNETTDPPDRVQTILGHRLPSSGQEPVHEEIDIAIESRAILRVAEGLFTEFACTPGNLEALGVGYAVTSGIVSAMDQIRAVSVTPDNPPEIHLELRRSDDNAATEPTEPLEDERFAVSGEVIRRVTGELSSRQTIFPQTGGTHGAGIFDATGQLQYFAEDVSRSNALDKAVGLALLEGERCSRYGVALSSRVSGQLVEKCASVGLQIIAAVSAPTTLAVEVADDQDITLCGFCREGRATVFTHPGRIQGMVRRSNSDNGG